VSSLRDRVSAELLPYLRQPGQYIGGEVNQLVREGDWERAAVRVALAFPDAYAVGMSHLGLHILYWLINHIPGCCAERVFCPWLDAEAQMRKRRLELFTWDTRQPVSSADIFAVSLQYELSFTNVLQLLDLAGIPWRAAERDDRHPLVLAGGPQADNPEPVAPFLDLVVLGDGEPALPALLDAYRQLRADGVRRRDMIPLLVRRFSWLYAPSLYDVRYHADGTIAAVEPKEATVPAQMTRCQATDFENAPVPVRPLVPYTEVVHDRIAIEIMRGCPQRCRFCHAGWTKRPVRWRSVERIVDLAEQMYAATGISELGLLSLSTSDYPRLRELTEQLNERFTPRRVSISVPSLRVDRMLQDVPAMVSAVRKSGLTLAVEAASPRLRQAIHKKVTDGDLLDGVRQAFAAGWRSVKLYFMAGFPGETEEDIDAIVDLSRQVSGVRRQLGKAPAAVTASVGWLVPKPFTPLQWAAQPRAEYFREVRHRLRDRVRQQRCAVHVKTHHVERSVLEAVFARGDRRLAAVIEHAYRAGARFDGWDECFDASRWDAAFGAAGIDPAWYAHRERAPDEVLPWFHLVHPKATPEYLRQQYEDLTTALSSVVAPGAAAESANGEG